MEYEPVNTYRRMFTSGITYGYKVPFAQWIIIAIYRTKLMIRRLSRFLYRARKYSYGLILPFFLLCVYIIGVYLWGKSLNSVFSFLDALWDTKSTAVSTLFISYSLTLYTQETSRQRRIVDRHSFYVETMYFLEEKLETLVGLLYCTATGFTFSHSLYTRSRCDFSIDSLKMYLPREDIAICIGDACHVLAEINTSLSERKKQCERYYLIEKDRQYMESAFSSAITSSQTLLRKIRNTGSGTTDSLGELLGEIILDSYFVVNELRSIWRHDEDIKKRIIEIVMKCTPVEELDYYDKLYIEAKE